MSKDWNYAQHSREVAEHGGVEQYNDDLRQDGYELRAAEDRKALEVLAALATGFLAAAEGVKHVMPWLKQKVEDFKAKRREKRAEHTAVEKEEPEDAVQSED